MIEYQVIARKFRPKLFNQVVGQEAIVTTLKNALKLSRLSHAYLFCGSKGTGKTTLARIFAKAMNCQSLNEDFEPCNQCPSCKGINSGSSLDVLEIDGASHRGIEDIRQINENIGYAPQLGKYKIYLIDEVHMLTKEAFNALLKSLEEPPEKVKFFFATTEPHKIPPTIISRCQRFNLNRILPEKIIGKLKSISDELKIECEKDALRLIAHLAEGGLRDAEVLFDQVLAFHSGKLTLNAVTEVLGIMPKERLFALDEAVFTKNIAVSFEIVHQLFSTGKNLNHFLDELTEHFRTHLLIKIQGVSTSLQSIDREQYTKTNQYYNQEQCLYIIDLLLEATQQLKSSAFKQTALEILLVKIIRSSHRISIDVLINRLNDLEKSLKNESHGSTIEDPSPKKSDLPQQLAVKASSVQVETLSNKSPQNTAKETFEPIVKKEEIKENTASQLQRKSRHDTLMRFAAKELEGNLSLKKLK